MDSESLSKRLFWVVFALTIATYSGALMAGFVWDDVPLVLQNRTTGSFSNTWLWFSSDLWAGAGSEGWDTGYFRPLMLMSLALDNLVWPGSEAGHHLQSLAWHMTAVLLLYRLLRCLVAPLPALSAVAIFSLHPLQSEAVIWVASRNDPMGAAFLFAGVLALLPERPSGKRVFAGFCLVLASLLTKESGLFCLVMLVALDLWRWGKLRNLWRYVAVGLALAVWAALRYNANVSTATLGLGEGVGILIERWYHVVGLYGGLVFAPWPLSSGRTIEYLSLPSGELWFGILSVLFFMGWLFRRGRGLALVGVGFAVVAFAPSLLAIAAKGQLGERYLYLPMAGLCIAVASALPSGRGALWVLGLLPLYIYQIGARLPDWADEIFLWEAALETDPSPYTQAGYGHMLNRRGWDLERAALQSVDTQSVNELNALSVEAFNDAERLFYESLNDDRPYRSVCTNVVRIPLRQGRLEAALENSRYALSRGCPAPDTSKEFYGLIVSVFAQNGLWDEVGRYLAEAQGDPMGRGVMVEGAYALTVHRPDVFCSLRESQSSAQDYDRAVRGVLAASGSEITGFWDEDGVANYCITGDVVDESPESID